MTIALVFDDLEDARIARMVITSRLAGDRSPVTEKPFGARLGQPATTVLEEDDRSLVIIDAQLMQGVSDWLTILSDRDLGFAYWLPGE
jgi:hypothetical protein